ncbi:MAG: phosphotransferase family protein [Actinomycetota bacterium]|nr:phosphotransferase family protein [Actinomycetota bacterium]
MTATDMTPAEEVVAKGLHDLMHSELPDAEDVRIEGLRRISEGLSRENWIFEGAWHQGGEAVRLPLILRRDPEGSLLETDRRTEYEMLRSLERAPLPTPRVLWLDEDGARLGRPSMVMVRESGECDWFVLNSRRPEDVRLRVARRLVSLLGQIHRVDWRSIGLDRVLTDPGPMASLAEVERWEDQLRRFQLEPHPEMELASSWLRARAPESQATVLVHGDYKPGNALLEGEDISAMLDWELAHLGDPLEDLGWATNPYRSREHQIPGLWEREQIVEHYSTETGFQVGEAELTWWNVFSCYKLATIILTGVSVFVAGNFDVIYQAPMSLYRVMFELMDAAE